MTSAPTGASNLKRLTGADVISYWSDTNQSGTLQLESLITSATPSMR